MESLHEVIWVQSFSSSPENGVLPPVTGSGAEEGFLEVASGYLAHEERFAGYLSLKAMPQLSSNEVPQHVVVVVDRRDRHVDLSGPVRLVPIGWALHQLELLDEIPPQFVQVVAVGVGVELALEVKHDERPAGEDEPIGPAPGSESLRVAVQLVLGDPGELQQPAGLLRE